MCSVFHRELVIEAIYYDNNSREYISAVVIRINCSNKTQKLSAKFPLYKSKIPRSFVQNYSTFSEFTTITRISEYYIHDALIILQKNSKLFEFWFLNIAIYHQYLLFF